MFSKRPKLHDDARDVHDRRYRSHDINAQDWNGHTALHKAYFNEKGKFKCPDCRMKGRGNACSEIFPEMKYLLNNGAKIDIRDYTGLTVVDYSVLDCELDALGILLNINIIPNNIDNKFLFGTYCLIKHNYFYKIAPTSCLTLLECSIGNRAMESFKFVLENTNINLNERIRYRGYTLLGLAVSLGEFQFVKALINKGVDPNARDSYNCCPIYYAITKPNTAIIQYLLDHGASANVSQIICGFTLLHMAVYLQLPQIVEMLLKNGADSNILFDNESPLIVAIDNQVKAGPSPNLKIIRLLLAFGANVNTKDRLGKTILNNACNEGNLEITKILLRYGANIEENDISTLHYAILGANPRIVKMILMKGADINHRSSIYGTPLELAVLTSGFEGKQHNLSLQCLLAHAAKFLVTGKYLNAENRRLLFGNEWINSACEVFVTELINMKKQNISPHLNFNFFDLLEKNIDSLGGALNQSELKVILDEKKYKKEFPKFFWDLQDRIQVAIRRRDLVESAMIILHECNKEMSHYAAMELFNYLSIEDLSNFVAAGCGHNFETARND